MAGTSPAKTWRVYFVAGAFRVAGAFQYEVARAIRNVCVPQAAEKEILYTCGLA